MDEFELLQHQWNKYGTLSSSYRNLALAETYKTWRKVLEVFSSAIRGGVCEVRTPSQENPTASEQ